MTLKVTFVPRTAAMFCGCCVIVGRTKTVRTALELAMLAPAFATTTL